MSHKAQPRAVMLVSNPCINDSRVIRAAEVVSSMGYKVTVLAVVKDNEAADEQRNGVSYIRLRREPLTLWRGLFGEKSWLGRYLAAAKGGASQFYASAPVEKSPPRHERTRLRTRLSNGLRSIDRTLFGDPPTPASGSTRALLRRAGRSALALLGKIKRSMRTILRTLARTFPAASRIAGRLARTLARAFRAAGRLARRLFAPVRQAIAREFGAVIEMNRLLHVYRDELDRLQPDVIHAHDLATLPAGSLAAAKTGAKLVYDSHELEVHRNVASGRLSRWARFIIERKRVRKADAVVTVCDSIADHLANAYRIPRPIVVMNAPNVSEAFRFDRDLRTDIGLAKEVPLAVYIGRITIGRGIEQCVQALVHWRGGRFALVGPVNQPTVDAAQALARDLGVADRLYVMPPVPPNAVTSYVRTADISLVAIQNVCLSYFYCLPNKLIESAHAGIPVVASNFPELRRFVEISGAGLLIDEKDPRDIAAALANAYRIREQLRPNAAQLAAVNTTYGWPTQKRALEGLYRSFGLLPATPGKGAKVHNPPAPVKERSELQRHVR